MPLVYESDEAGLQVALHGPCMTDAQMTESARKLRARLRNSQTFRARDGHPCSGANPEQRHQAFLEIAGKIWGRLCREHQVTRECSQKADEQIS